MDGKGFQVWLSAARGLTRAQRREALAVLSGRSEARHRRPRSSLVWTRPGAVRTARAKGRFRAVWRGVCVATSARLRQDLQRADRYAAVGLAPQGTLAVVRGVAGEGGDGEGLGGALRRGGEHGVPLASPVLAAARSDSEVLKGIVESDETYVLESRKGARGLGRQGTAAGRQGEEARPFARAGAGSHGGGPERDDGQRCAAQGRCGGAHGCSRPGGREGTPCWSPTVARATHLAPPRSG